MTTLAIEKATAPLAHYARQMNGRTLVLTKKGRPVAALTPLENTDWESIAVSTSPKFIKIVQRARAQRRAGLGYSSDELRREFGVPKRPRRAPTPRAS